MAATRNSPARPDYAAPALEKGLDILELLAREGRALSLSELGERLGRTTTEIFRMLDVLVRRGYLLKDAHSGAYRLSLRMYELAHTHSPVEQLLPGARVAMAALADQLGESCHLGVASGTDLVVLAQAESARRVRISIEVGARFPLARTASGRLLLAVMTEDDRRRALAGLPAGDRRHLSAEVLAGLRGDGYCLAVEESVRGVIDLAVAVGRPEVGILASLAVTAFHGGDADAFLRTALPAMRAAASTITANAGLSP